MNILVATGNAGKMKEFREVLDNFSKVLSMKEAGIKSDPEETGSTFRENALIKAGAVREILTGPEFDWKKADLDPDDTIVIADDSGLIIDAMPDELGVKSARFMGHDTSYDIKNKEILRRMADVEDEKRTARFVCAIALIFPDGSEYTEEGVMEGRIAHVISGNGGFGYDPIFFLPDLGCTSADLTADEKNAISHRGKALRAAAALIERKING